MLDSDLQPGIYFNLTEAKYHEDPALSRSDVVHLLDTPYTYWKNSWMNVERKRKHSTDAMDYGSAFHYLLFEPHKFEKLYQVVPIDAWDVNKSKIQYEEYQAMIESIKVLRAGKDSSLFLSGGMPEVTIVFDFAGHRWRTRHDYFTPVVSVDFKTSWSLHEAHIKKDFDKFGYDIQNTLYKKSRIRFKEQFNRGEAHVYGNIDAAWFAKFIESELNEFVFLFQRKSEPYPYIPLMPEDDTEESGMLKMEKAIKIYNRYWKSHGRKPWPVCEGTVKRFSMYYGIQDAELN